ncbi:hypothetical protein LBKG_00214 [Lactobacillus crispatus CTV-05]|nr:hypothetical protein HMPREF0506_1141 [Lactobacillus crispatus JV-V01]EFQ45258.1 hypothetical protein LBKG_00214 [Lactobacillus crispatus CTV-05]
MFYLTMKSPMMIKINQTIVHIRLNAFLLMMICELVVLIGLSIVWLLSEKLNKQNKKRP